MKNLYNFACPTPLYVLYDYLSVALCVSLMVQVKLKVWGYSVTLVALVLALRLSAIRLL